MNVKLNIGVISRVKSPTVQTELAREADLRGHSYTRIVFDEANLTEIEVTFAKADLLKYDVLYYRTSLGPIWALALQKYLARHNRKAINLIVAESPFLDDKAQQAVSAASSGVPVPKTIIDMSDNYASIESQLGSVFVAKAGVSSQGKDVHLIRSKAEFDTFAKNRAEKDYIYQEYMPHDYDCRVHLIEGKAVCGYRREQDSEDFRCNVSLGASMKPLGAEDVSALFPLANKLSKSLNLQFHVVDFLLNKEDGEYYFIEINDNPGWETLDTEATGVDMSALVIDSFERVVGQENKQKIFNLGYKRKELVVR